MREFHGLVFRLGGMGYVIKVHLSNKVMYGVIQWLFVAAQTVAIPVAILYVNNDAKSALLPDSNSISQSGPALDVDNLPRAPPKT